MQENIFIFCGGPRLYNDLSKGFYNFDYKEPLLVINYRNLKNSYKNIIYLINEDDEDSFNTLKKDFNLVQAECITFNPKSTTLEKAVETFEHYKNQNSLNFSYVDILSEESFWDIKPCDLTTIKIVPFRSRFPKITLDPFTNKVKGVTMYNSRVPANKSYIFAGFCQINKSHVIELLNSEFSDKGQVDLEVKLFDQLSLKNKLVAVPYYKKWLHIDSKRDLIKFHG